MKILHLLIKTPSSKKKQNIQLGMWQILSMFALTGVSQSRRLWAKGQIFAVLKISVPRTAL